MDLAAHGLWEEIAEARRAGRPMVWRQPFGGPITSAQSVFEAMCEVARRRREGDAPLTHRLFADGKPVALTDTLMADPADGSMAGYVARLGEALGEVGFVVNDLQAVDAEMWRLAAGIMAGLQRAIGVVPGGASFDVFAGAYQSGFFGVHKDDQEVVTFVIEGRKRFLLWPYEVLKDHAQVPAHSAARSVLLEGVEVAALRERAIVIEGDPGDVFYWPADYWHVAESDGGLCTTVGIGLFARATPTQMLERAAQELCDEGIVARPGELPRADEGDVRALVAAAKSAIGRALDSEAIEARLEDNLVAMASAYGFGKVPPVRARVELGERVRAAAGAVVWLLRGDELMWSVGGAIFRYPAAPGLVRLFGRLGRGEELEVAEVVAELEAEIEPAAVRHVLELVARHHGLCEG